MPRKHYRAKPITIEAVEWTGENITEVAEFCGSADYTHIPTDNELQIHTSEGTMTADKGDFIIRDNVGHFYPCKPAVFHHKYEYASIVHPEFPNHADGSPAI